MQNKAQTPTPVAEQKQTETQSRRKVRDFLDANGGICVTRVARWIVVWPAIRAPSLPRQKMGYAHASGARQMVGEALVLVWHLVV